MTHTKSKLHYLALAGIVASIIIIYYPTLKAYFIVDDYMWINVVGDKGYQMLPSFFTDVHEVGFFRPFIKLAFWLDYAVHGLNQEGYHITNIILHIINTLLVFSLCYSITANKPVATLASLIFALHPMHTESISYISGRTELIHALFFLISIICFIKYIRNRHSKRFYYISILTFSLSLLTKETAVSLIFVMALSETFLELKSESNENNSPIWEKYIPYLLILISYIFLRQFIIKATVYGIRYDAIWYRPIYYFARVFLPLNMHTILNQSLSLKLLMGISGALVLFATYHYLYDDLKQYKQLILYCSLWIVIIFFPVYFNPGERYAYLPSIGSSTILALIIIQGVKKTMQRHTLIAYVFLGVIVSEIIAFSYIRISERNKVFFKVGEIARGAVLQLLNQQPTIPHAATLYFINPPEKWINESEIWTRPYFTTFDDAVQINYHDPSLKVYYNDADNTPLTDTKDKLSFLINNGLSMKVKKAEKVFVFEYQKNTLIERTADFIQRLGITTPAAAISPIK
jgi:hypothetical protein